uniref:Uncharacterized protein n=1 Tax=Musa acuminata subsp. malaccensis TaxID=214687 RepID=A0A804U5S6_MUSAM
MVSCPVALVEFEFVLYGISHTPPSKPFFLWPGKSCEL